MRTDFARLGAGVGRGRSGFAKGMSLSDRDPRATALPNGHVATDLRGSYASRTPSPINVKAVSEMMMAAEG